MKDEAVTTITREVALRELPKSWRESFSGRETVLMTIEDVPQKPFHHSRANRKAILEQVAGVWADRTDEEIEAWQQNIREARRKRFEYMMSPGK